MEPQIAFATHTDPPGLEIRVNFGMFAGREATNAELDDLAQALLPRVGQVTVLSEQRRELSADSEAAVHQVRVEIGRERLPAARAERESLADELVAAAERWAEACIADRHAEIAEL